MRSSHCARGKDSAGGGIFSAPFGYRACRSILRNPRRYRAAPYKGLAFRAGWPARALGLEVPPGLLTAADG
jgi:hypothetical protein